MPDAVFERGGRALRQRAKRLQVAPHALKIAGMDQALDQSRAHRPQLIGTVAEHFLNVTAPEYEAPHRKIEHVDHAGRPGQDLLDEAAVALDGVACLPFAGNVARTAEQQHDAAGALVAQG
jgi:hypothetical protein